MVETGRASAFVMDEVLLAGFVANAKTRKTLRLSARRCPPSRTASCCGMTRNSRRWWTRP